MTNFKKANDNTKHGKGVKRYPKGLTLLDIRFLSRWIIRLWFLKSFNYYHYSAQNTPAPMNTTKFRFNKFKSQGRLL